MSESARRIRSQRQVWAAPGSSHDRIVRIALIVLPGTIGVVGGPGVQLAKVDVENVGFKDYWLPLYGEPMRRQLQELARDWERAAVPSHGRYVNAPAVADERGVLFVPPAVTDPQLVAVASVGVAVAAGALLLRATRRA